MEFESSPEDSEQYSINYALVANEKGLLSITRLLATSMAINPYMSIGDFLKNLSDHDLQTLLEIIDFGEDHTNFDDIMLLSGMLSAAEGIPCKSIDDYHKCMNMFMTFLTVESLYRKKLVKIFRENMSFGDDMMDAKVAEKLDD